MIPDALSMTSRLYTILSLADNVGEMAEWSKALESGSSLSGREFESRSRHCECVKKSIFHIFIFVYIIINDYNSIFFIQLSISAKI